MAKLVHLKEIILIGILLFLVSEVSANSFFYAKLNITSLTNSEKLKDRKSAEFTAAAARIGGLVRGALIANASNTILTDATVLSVQVQQFRHGTEAILLIEVKDDPNIEAEVNKELATAVENGTLGQETVESSSLEIIFSQTECGNGYVIDFVSKTCLACPIGTYQDAKGQCDACPKDTSTTNNATVGVGYCLNVCLLDTTYCNLGLCTYLSATGVTCKCPGSFGVRIGGKRCETLVTFYVSFNITSQDYSNQLKNKSSEAFKNISTLVENLFTDVLVSSNNNLLIKDKIDDVHLLSFEPGLNAALRIDIANASTIEPALTSVVTGAIQSGVLGQETVASDSLIIINNVVACSGGSIMDFNERKCISCPRGTYEPIDDLGQCENCPFGTNTTFSGTLGEFRCIPFCNLNLGHCMNGGTCDFVTQGENLGERCFCPFDYSGKRCEDVLTVVQDVLPNYGPEAGGTTITISGVHFDMSRDLSVTIGASICTDVTGNDTQLVCQTGMFNKSVFSFREKLDLTIEYTTPPEVAVAKAVYSYRRNPKIEEIKPLATFKSGGLMLTVMGRYMDGVYEPKLMTKINFSNNTQTVLKSDCNVENSNTLLCPTPNIDFEIPSITTEARKKRSAALQRIKRQTDNTTVTSIKVGFEFDGLQRYQDLSGSLASYSTLTIFPDPKVEVFDPQIRSFNQEESSKLIIKGKNFNDNSILGSFYKVLIGKAECTNLKIKPTELECEVPKNPSNSSNYKVQLTIGGLVFTPGYLKYMSGFWNDEVAKYAIVGSAIGVAALIVSAVSAWIFVSTTKFMKPSKGKDSHNASLVTDNTSEDDLESIIPNPMEGYNHENLPKFNSARFYTSTSRGRAYDNPSMGSTSNSRTFMY